MARRPDTGCFQCLHYALCTVEQKRCGRWNPVVGKAPLDLLQRQADQQRVAMSTPQQAAHILVGRFPARSAVGELQRAEHTPHLAGAERGGDAQCEHYLGEAAGAGAPGAVDRRCLEAKLHRQGLTHDYQAHGMAIARFARQQRSDNLSGGAGRARLARARIVQHQNGRTARSPRS